MNNQSNLNSFQIISCRSATYYVILSGAAQRCNGDRRNQPLPRSRTPEGRPQAESRQCVRASKNKQRFFIIDQNSISHATISLLCHLRGSRHPHNNQHPKQFTPTNQARSRTFCRCAPPDTPKNFPVRQPPPEKRKKVFPSLRRLPCREVRGGSGRLGGRGNPL